MTWLRAAFFLLLWGLAAGCSQPEPPTVSLASISGNASDPTMLFEGFRMSSANGAAREWEFEARAAQVFEKIHLAKAQDIRVQYWKQGKLASTLTAGRGIIQTDTNDMRAEQNVVMVSQEGVLLYTERLNWDHKRNKIYTDLPVRVVRNGSLLTGVGLETDSELKHLEILSQVKIAVQSLKELNPPKKPAGSKP